MGPPTPPLEKPDNIWERRGPVARLQQAGAAVYLGIIVIGLALGVIFAASDLLAGCESSSYRDYERDTYRDAYCEDRTPC